MIILKNVPIVFTSMSNKLVSILASDTKSDDNKSIVSLIIVLKKLAVRVSLNSGFIAIE